MEYLFVSVSQFEWLSTMDLEVDQIVDEKSITFLEPQQKKSTIQEKWWHINKKLFRFKLHFFLLGGALSAVVPFVAVFAKNTLGLSATSFGVIMTFQQFFFALTKPTIGYITDYFNKLKAIIFVLAIGQGLFLFFLLLIPPLDKDTIPKSAGIGNIVAGVGFDYLGGRKTFLCAGIFFGCCSLFSVSCTIFNRKRKVVVQNNNGNST